MSSICDAANLLGKRLLTWVYREIRRDGGGTGASYDENPIFCVSAYGKDKTGARGSVVG
jgi:hypothetical protein